MSVRKSLAWTFSGQITSLLLTFASAVIVARLLSPLEMGVYGIGMAIAGLIAVIGTFGMNSYLVRETAVTEDTVALAFTVNGIINIAISAIIFLSSYFGERYFESPAVGPVLRLLAIPPLIGIFEFLPSALQTRDMKFKAVSLVRIGGSVINAVVMVALAYRGFSSLSMPYATIAASAFRVLAFAIFFRQHTISKLSFRGWQAALVFGVRMITVSGVAQISQRLSDVILGSLLGLAALGIYSRASNLSSLLFVNLYGTATAVIFAQLSKSFRETGNVREVFLHGLEMILALMWPVLIGLAVLAGPVIHLLYGRKWVAAATPLSLLLVGQFVVLTFGMNWELFVIRNETARQTKYEVMRSSVGLVFFALGCLFSLGGAAIGRIAEALTGAVLYLPKMPKMADSRRSDLTAIYAKSSFLTVAAAGPSLVVMLANGWSTDTPLPVVAFGIVAGIALWFLTLRYLRHPLLDEIKLFVSTLSQS